MAKSPKPNFGKPGFGKPAPRTNPIGKPYTPRPRPDADANTNARPSASDRPWQAMSGSRPSGPRPGFDRPNSDRPNSDHPRPGKPPYPKSVPAKPTFTKKLQDAARATPLPPGSRPWEAVKPRADSPRPPADVPPVARPIHTKAKSPFVPASLPLPADVPIADVPVAEAPAVPKPAAPKAVAAPKKSATPKAAPMPPPEAEPETPLATFADLELSEPVARAVSDLGFEAPTPIQARSIPLLLAGRDLIGQAQTGTGKTAAFALPLIQQIVAAGGAKEPVTQALILEPTRELAIQVAGGIHDLAKHTGMRVVPVYGGQPLDRQFRALRDGAQVVVGTHRAAC